MNSHFHVVVANTDSLDHFHQIRDVTGPAIEVGNGRHIHFDCGTTSFEDGHTHTYQFATLLENQIRR